MSFHFVYKAELEHFDIQLKPIENINKKMILVHQIVRFQFDIHDYKETGYAYIFKNIFGQDLILDRKWTNCNNITIISTKKSLFIHNSRTRICNKKKKKFDIVKYNTIQHCIIDK